MGRPPLPVGTFGEITVSSTSPYKARVRYRDRGGVIRYVARFGQTKTAAKNALKAALAEFQHAGEGLNQTTRINALADEWLASVDTSERSGRTKEHYRYAVDRYVRPHLGQLRISEATTAVCDRALNTVAVENGPSAAKTMKAVLTGMLGLAVRHDAIDTNPVRETKTANPRRKTVRALTAEETDELCQAFVDDEGARVRAGRTPLDLSDLIEFMLSTGCRIGESLAVRDAVLDLAAGTVEVNATVIRLKGQGLIVQERPKTAAGWRVLALPPKTVVQLGHRDLSERLKAPSGVVFGSPHNKAIRDPSNTAADLRGTLDRVSCTACGGRGWHAHLKTEKQNLDAPAVEEDNFGLVWNEPCAEMPPFAWVTSHTFRKTVATRLDQAGWTARQIADQLGHAQPSMTMDVYMGRKVVSADAARALAR